MAIGAGKSVVTCESPSARRKRNSVTFATVLCYVVCDSLQYVLELSLR